MTFTAIQTCVLMHALAITSREAAKRWNAMLSQLGSYICVFLLKCLKHSGREHMAGDGGCRGPTCTRQLCLDDVTKRF